MNGLELNIVLGNYVDWIKRDWLYSPRLGPTIKSNLFYGVSPTKRADQTSQVVDFTANSIHFNIVESNLIGSKQQRLSCIFFRKKNRCNGFFIFFWSLDIVHVAFSISYHPPWQRGEGEEAERESGRSRSRSRHRGVTPLTDRPCWWATVSGFSDLQRRSELFLLALFI